MSVNAIIIIIIIIRCLLCRRVSGSAVQYAYVRCVRTRPLWPEAPTAHRPQPLSHSFARSFIYVNLNQHAKIST